MALSNKQQSAVADKIAVTILASLALLVWGCAVSSSNQKLPADTIELPQWHRPDDTQSVPFELGDGAGRFHPWGEDRTQQTYNHYFDEFLPALFERTIVFETFKPGQTLEWIFTGDRAGFTVTIDAKTVTLHRRYYDSFVLNEISKDKSAKADKSARHPQCDLPARTVGYTGCLQAVTVTLDYKFSLCIALNGKTVIQQKYLHDVTRQQLILTRRGGLTGGNSKVSGSMLSPLPKAVAVRIDSDKKHQEMMGFGGITSPTAYAQLSPRGKNLWWQLITEYNLLIQREYPIGTRLNPDMNNFDRLEDATPHYYGDNFPNGEISDFEYIRTLRTLGGKVWFEFWALPEWVGDDVDRYTSAVLGYCRTSKEKTGVPPDVVGIQNEITHPPKVWHAMTLALRKKLDDAGFGNVRIHMSDHSYLKGGINNTKAFRSERAVWDAIDYSATHMYDYQDHFTNPDAYDALLIRWKTLTADKPFLSTELCINAGEYQIDSYRVALTMAQLYHKNLTIADASAICYCWLLLDVVQPSYGWTRSLFVSDRANGFLPAPSSHQLRTFGAYSRRIKEGMVRIKATADDEDVLVCAFESGDGAATVVLLNRATAPRQLLVDWPDVRRGGQVSFSEMELVDQYNQNTVQKAPAPANGKTEITIAPGAIITLANVALNQANRNVLKSNH